MDSLKPETQSPKITTEPDSQSIQKVSEYTERVKFE